MSRWPPPHSWDLTPAQAIELQQTLRREVVLARRESDPRWVAGVDVGFEQRGTTALAAATVFSFPGLEALEQRLARRPVTFPYVPGLLSFRELPAVLDALNQLRQVPDLVLCDGQGIAHPRRFGIAAHLGVATGLTTVGVGKSRLVGQHDEPGLEKGSTAPLLDGAERIGTVVRTRSRVRPVYVSPGHRTDFEQSTRWVLACVGHYRLPEPIRLADRLASHRRGA